MLLWMWLCVVNVFGFCSAVYDKRLAKKGARRTPERRFTLYAALGGAAGVLLAFYIVRHKTKHFKLLVTIWGLLCINMLIVAFAVVRLSAMGV